MFVWFFQNFFVSFIIEISKAWITLSFNTFSESQIAMEVPNLLYNVITTEIIMILKDKITKYRSHLFFSTQLTESIYHIITLTSSLVLMPTY